MAELIQLCITKNDTRVMRKKWSVIKNNVSVNLKHPTDLFRPTFILHKGDLPDTVNYIIWRGRKYFASPPVFVEGGLVEISCKEDTLTTFANQLANVNTLILRQENVWNPYIVDSQLPVRTERKISFKKIGNIGNPNGHNIVLTVGGGKHLEQKGE